MQKLLLFLAAIFSVACSQIQIPSDSKLPTEIDFSVQMGSYATKATDTAFEEGDQMNLAAIWFGVEETPRSIDVRKATYKNGKITLDNPLYWPEESGWDEANFVMVYPYMPGFTQDNILEFINGDVFFTVKADQSTHALYTSSDLIMGGCYELQETDAPCTVKMTLAHTLSQVSIVITNKSEFGIKDVYLADVYGTYEINRGKLSGSKGKIKTCNSGNGQWTCVVPPQTGEPKILITTTDNRTIEFKAPSEIELPQSVRTNLLLTLNDNTEVSDFSYEIANWNPGQDFNFSQNGWESVGTGAIQDSFFGGDFFPVEIERNKENARSFRVKDPYSGIKQKYYPTDAPIPDDYLYFRIFDKGETFQNVSITRDNVVYFEAFAPGAYMENYNQNLTITHPSLYYSELALWKYSRVVWFQDNGTPGQVNLAPMYWMDNGLYWDYIGYVEQITILFPDCDIKSYRGAITAEDGPYGKGITKENGKTFLSFNVAKIDPDVSSLRVAAFNGDVVYYEDLLNMEDGVVDSRIITEQSKRIDLEIPDNYASHAIYIITYGDGYPQWRYRLILRDESADFGNWEACGKGSYEFSRLKTGTADDLILYRNTQDNRKYMIKEWWSPTESDLQFAWNDDENDEFTINPQQALGTYNDAPLYISDYTAFHPASNKSFYSSNNDYLYHSEGEGIFYFMTCYHSEENPGGGYKTFEYGYETFYLTGNESDTKSSLVLKSAASKKRGEHVKIEKFQDEGMKAHRHSAPEPKAPTGASAGFGR